MSIHLVAILSSAAENHKKSLKTPFWGFKVIQDHHTTKNHVISVCYDSSISVPICNHFKAGQANIGTIITF